MPNFNHRTKTSDSQSDDSVLLLGVLMFLGLMAWMVYLFLSTPGYKDGVEMAQASQILNEGSQLLIANEMHRHLHGEFAPSPEHLLAAKMLTSVPTASHITEERYALSDEGSVSLAGVSYGVCQEAGKLNSKASYAVHCLESNSNPGKVTLTLVPISTTPETSYGRQG